MFYDDKITVSVYGVWSQSLASFPEDVLCVFGPYAIHHQSIIITKNIYINVSVYSVLYPIVPQLFCCLFLEKKGQLVKWKLLSSDYTLLC